MVAFGFLLQTLEVVGSTNSTLSFYECRFSGGDTLRCWGHSTLPYLFELLTLTVDREAKTLGTSHRTIAGT